MKRILFGVAFLALVIGVSSCGDSGTSPSAGGSGPGVSGIVTDAVSASPVSGVKVALGAKTATTGADGKYSLTGLTAGSASLTAQHQGHVNFTQTVQVGSTASTVNVALTPSQAFKAQGNWSGSWKNTTFNTTGAVTMNVTVDTVQQTLQLILDLNGGVFGLGDPPAETFTGAYLEAGTSLTKTSALLGTVATSITPAGQISGSCTGVPNANISRVDFNGLATATNITINYTVTFTAGGSAVGTMTLTK